MRRGIAAARAMAAPLAAIMTIGRVRMARRASREGQQQQRPHDGDSAERGAAGQEQHAAVAAEDEAPYLTPEEAEVAVSPCLLLPVARG